MSNPEQFPSKDELEAAEQHLTPKQAEASAYREKVFNLNSAMNEGRNEGVGVSGALMLRKEGPIKEGPYQQVFEGELNGHKVILKIAGARVKSRPSTETFGGTTRPNGSESYQVSKNYFAATVDGLEMSPEQARRIFQKYTMAFMSEGTTENDLEAIEQEKEAFKRQQIEKDLGL